MENYSMSAESKIAFIFSQFPCYDETFILREMNELKSSGLEFEIYSLKTPKDKIVHDEAKELAQKTSYLPFVSLRLQALDLFFLFHHPGRYFCAFFGTLLRLLKSPEFFFKTGCLWHKAVGFAWLAREQGITHVHGQWATYPATVAYIISKLNNIPFSFTGHAHDIYLDTTLLAFKIKRAKFIVTCTEDNKRYLLNIAKSENIIVNHHGVDLERFRNEIIGRNVEGRKFRILSVGSLLECKGFEYLIEACGMLKEKGIDFECAIAGGGRLEQSLKSRVTSSNLEDCVKFTGYIKQEELIPLYKQADVLVLAMVPDKHWGIPNVLIEAMAASVPVVCTMLPSIPELIEDGKTGFIIPAKDPAAIAVIVEKLCLDEALRKRMGETGRKVVEEKFDVVKNSEKLKQLMRTMLYGSENP
jgi:glycosyltransferase involved in cell wall biosynthesis